MTKSTKHQAPAQAAGNGRSIAITFARPDVYYEIPPELLDTWGDDPFLAIKDIGFFLRVVLQVRLDDGSRVDFGTWLEIHSEDFRTAWQTWNFPEYKNLVVEGYVGNEIAPWGKFPHVLVRATVRDVDEVPLLESCPDLNVMRIVDGIWPRDQVLAPYAGLLGDGPKPPKAAGRRTAGSRGKRKPNSGPVPGETQPASREKAARSEGR
jgi:hypothetical protein